MKKEMLHYTIDLEKLVRFEILNILTSESSVGFSRHPLIYILKGALDNFNLIPRFFSKKVEIFIPLEVYPYVVTACSILLATSTQLQRYLNFYFRPAIFKSRLLKTAATVVTVEFDTIHHYSSLEENFEFFLCSSLDRYKKLTEQYEL